MSRFAASFYALGPLGRFPGFTGFDLFPCCRSDVAQVLTGHVSRLAALDAFMNSSFSCNLRSSSSRIKSLTYSLTLL